MRTCEFNELKDTLIRFRDERDWEQFHDSKNLALALSIEAAELNELFLWKKDDESESVDREKLKDELADVFAYAIMLAGKHDLDDRWGILYEPRWRKTASSTPWALRQNMQTYDRI